MWTAAGVLLRVLLRLEVGPLFVVHPPHQHGVSLCHNSSDLLSHLLVEVREVPFLRRLHDAVQRHELRRHDSPHKYLLRSILQTLTRPCIGHRGHAGDRARPTTTTSSHARPYGPSGGFLKTQRHTLPRFIVVGFERSVSVGRAGAYNVSVLPFCPYSSKCLEGVFSEVLHSPGPMQRTSYVEYQRARPSVHKNPILPA